MSTATAPTESAAQEKNFSPLVRQFLDYLRHEKHFSDYTVKSYVRSMQKFTALMKRFPTIRFVLVMGPPVGFFGKSGQWEFPEPVLEAYRNENLLIEVMFPITWGGKWDYPYPEAQRLIHGMRDTFGAGKLVWGSDMPNVERFCTYGQSLEYLRRYCDFLPASDMDRILGDNAARLYRISAA